MRGAPAGPIGIATGIGQEAMGAGQDMLNKAGYSAGGKVTDIAAGLGAPPELAAGLGAGANVAVSQGPGIVVGGELAKTASPVLDAAGKLLMRSALKPTLAASQAGKADVAVQTMLDKGLNVNKSGLDALRLNITDLNNQVKDILKNSTAQADISGIGQAFSKLKKATLNQASWQDDLATVKKAFSEFLENPQLQRLQNPTQIPIQVANDIKRGTQQSIASSYGTKGNAWEESQKAIAATLRQAIEKAAPEVKPLNAEQAKLMDTLSIAERRDMIAANKNPLALSLLARSPEAIAAFMADRSELFKSLLARMLYSGQEQIPANIARVGIGAASTLQQ